MSRIERRLVLALAMLTAPRPVLQCVPGWQLGRRGRLTLAQRLRDHLWRRLPASPDGAFTARFYDSVRLQLHPSNEIETAVYVEGCYEPNEFVWLASVLHPGMTVVDVGASAGLYALFAARRVGAGGRVYAIEPSQRDFERLLANAELNDADNLTCVALALGEATAPAELKVASIGHEGHNTLGAFAYASVSLEYVETVTTRSLDDLAAELEMPHIDVLKVDAEGAELAILRGAEGVLRRDRPLLLIELQGASLAHQGASVEAVADLLTDLDYRLFDFDPATGSLRLCNALPASLNAVAYPRERCTT